MGRAYQVIGSPKKQPDVANTLFRSMTEPFVPLFYTPDLEARWLFDTSPTLNAFWCTFCGFKRTPPDFWFCPFNTYFLLWFCIWFRGCAEVWDAVYLHSVLAAERLTSHSLSIKCLKNLSDPHLVWGVFHHSLKLTGYCCWSFVCKLFNQNNLWNAKI